jgi:hypothetical protein
MWGERDGLPALRGMPSSFESAGVQLDELIVLGRLQDRFQEAVSLGPGGVMPGRRELTTPRADGCAGDLVQGKGSETREDVDVQRVTVAALVVGRGPSPFEVTRVANHCSA